MQSAFKYFIVVFFVILSNWGMAQHEFASTQEMETAATNFYNNGEYSKAFPMYSQMLSLDRTNPILNYRFGVCLLYSDRSDTYAPIEYLKKGLDQLSDIDVYFHLGFAYHINYNFPAAISYYEKYKAQAGKKANKNFEVDRKIEMCRNGMTMMQSVRDLFVMQKTEVARQDFFRSYELRDFGGRIIKKPETFASKEDVKMNTNDFMFFNSKAPVVYYAAYGKDSKAQKDIFRRTRNQDGSWSEAEKLPESINTPYDDDFPVMMPDGKTLYFSSNGHNTMGGFDIFKSVLDPKTLKWSIPENINFPFNTPVDDILFVSDTSETTAWFASVRNSVNDKIMVYKVGILKRPQGSEDLASIYKKNQQLTEADLKKIKDKARLDVNISEDEFKEIPEPVVQNQIAVVGDFEKGEDMIARKLQQNKTQDALLDSVRHLIDKFDIQIQQQDSIRQLALTLSIQNTSKAEILLAKARNSLKSAQVNKDMTLVNESVKTANTSVAQSRKYAYVAQQQSDFAEGLKNSISQKHDTLSKLNLLYGNAQHAMINGNFDEAKFIISGMVIPGKESSNTASSINIPFDNMEKEAVTLPAEYIDAESFQPFEVSTESGKPMVVTVNADYENLLPGSTNSEIANSSKSFSNNPSRKVDEYIEIINEKLVSEEIRSKNLQNQIEIIKSKWAILPENEKTEKLAQLNALQKEFSVLSSQILIVRQNVSSAETEYKKQLLSAASPESKRTVYRHLATHLEKVYDFGANSFVSTGIPTTEAISYAINQSGDLEQKAVGSGDLGSQESLSFNEQGSSIVKERSTQILADIRNQEKQNDFLAKKIDLNIPESERNLNTALAEANVLLQQAKDASTSNKKVLVNQANEKFSTAIVLSQNITAYKNIQQTLLDNSTLSETIMVELSSENEKLNQGLNQKNWEQAKSSFSKQEELAQKYQTLNQSLSLVDKSTGLLLAPPASQGSSKMVYEVTSAGSIVKNIGNPAKQWTSSQDLMQDLTPSADATNPALELAPNTTLSSNTKQLALSFAPLENPENTGLTFKAPELKSSVASSTNSLVRSTSLQVDNLKNEIEKLTNKRNALESEYTIQISEAAKYEEQSLKILNTIELTVESVETANMLSRQSKQSLYKAALISQIIKKTDRKIWDNSKLLAESVSTADQVLAYVNSNESDEALLLNVQLQRKVASQDNTINDASFNYETGEILAPATDIFNRPENSEFLIVDGKIQRNDQSGLLSFYHSVAPETNTNLVSSNFFSWSTESKISQDSAITESNAQMGNVRNSTTSGNESADISQLIQSYKAADFNDDNDVRNALAQLNFAAQTHLSDVNNVTYQLTLLAEQKLNNSNEFLLKLESGNGTPELKRLWRDSSAIFLNQALALKQLTEKYSVYANAEEQKKNQITQSSFEIEKAISGGQLEQGKSLFTQMQNKVGQFSDSPNHVLNSLKNDISVNSVKYKTEMDSLYLKSQDLANQSVMMLSQASEERKKADGKKNAFKRREMIKKAEDLELQATQLQNESEKALAQGNMLYQSSEVALALGIISSQIYQTVQNSGTASIIPVNREIVFSEIDNRKKQIYQERYITSEAPTAETESNSVAIGKTDLRAYERENFKAEMISEELELIKREIVMLSQASNSNLTDKEIYLNTQKVKLLRIKADSLEYEAQLVFNLANSILETLSADEQKTARKNSRDFNAYLQDLKTQIEKLLSEASTLKQRAERSNNLVNRDELLKQATEKEGIAMYLILEEFEVIAQKNKTRYRKNQLVLQQILLEKATLQERELMTAIFAQIDDYFSQTQLKHLKANEPGISFTMKKILLQDAYSLEMKALDLQQQAQTMLEKHDINSMLAFQPKQSAQQELAQTNSTDNNQEKKQKQNREVEIATSQTKTLTPENNTPTVGQTSTDVKSQISFEIPASGLVYKVQFLAIKELKSADFFKQVPEVSAERVSNSTYIRYFSGQFNEIEAAIIRRNSLRASGFPEAFIKSWRNGESINLLASQTSAGGGTNSSSVPVSNSVETVINNVDFSANNITALQGTYFTVQIGVYTRPRTSNSILGISPLYHKRLNNGYWVYYSGIYKSMEEANSRKDEIVAHGVADAFVVAFTDGKSVNITSAMDIIERGGQIPSDEDIVILEDASTRLNSDWSIAQNSTIENTSSNTANNFRIQVGVYSNPVNLDWISSQLDGNESIEMSRNSNGKYVYSLGNFTSEKEARHYLPKVKELVNDAFVVGFRDGKKLYF